MKNTQKIKSKTTYTYILLTMLLFTIGCGESDIHENGDNIVVETNSGQKQDNIKIEYEEAEPKETQQDVSIISNQNENIQIIDSVFYRSEQRDLVEIEVHYPQICNYTLDDGLKLTDKINQTIYEYVYLEEYIEWTGRRYNVDLNYTITYLDDKYMSIVFEGYYNEYNHPLGATALNFDLETGEVIKLSDYANWEQMLIDVQEDVNLIQDDEMLRAVGDREGVIEFLEKFDVDKNINNWAISENGISFFVPWEYSNGRQGEYVIVEMSYSNT